MRSCIKERKYWKTCLFLLLLMCFMASANASTPSARPDLSPGVIGSWWKPHHERIVEAAQAIPEFEASVGDQLDKMHGSYSSTLRELSGKRDGASRIAIIGKSRSDWDQEIREAEAEYRKQRQQLEYELSAKYHERIQHLHNLLASPSNDELKERFSQAPVNSAHREVFEIHAAINNLRQVTYSQVERLKSNPSDYQLASDAYRNLGMLVDHVIEMHDLFLSRVDSHYYPMIGRVERRLDQHEAALKRDSNIRPELLESELSRVNAMRNNLKVYRQALPGMQQDVQERVGVLRRQAQEIDHLDRGVRIAGSISIAVNQLMANYQDLDMDTPDIPEYEVELIELGQ